MLQYINQEKSSLNSVTNPMNNLFNISDSVGSILCSDLPSSFLDAMCKIAMFALLRILHFCCFYAQFIGFFEEYLSLVISPLSQFCGHSIISGQQ